jgi:hypothetical protein
MDLYHSEGKNFKGENIKLTHCSGPVIKNDNNEFLLHRAESTGKYQFTGGRLSDKLSLQENAIFRPMEDLKVKVKLRNGLEPLIIVDKLNREGEDETIVLVHYLADLESELDSSVGDWVWKNISEISKMDSNKELSSPNIKIACEYFLNK